MSDTGIVLLLLLGGLVALSWILSWISNANKKNNSEKEHAEARRKFED